jgi:hypothetical protein
MKKIKLIFLMLLLASCENQKKTNQSNTNLFILAAISSNQSSTTNLNQDQTLYNESRASNLSFFPNTPSSIFNSGISDRAHGDQILMKVNQIAKDSINAGSKIPIGGSFQENSLIVKERYSSGRLTQIIVMKKNKSATSTWLWGEYSPTGSIDYSITNNGSSCTGCHSKGKDFVRIFEY